MKVLMRAVLPSTLGAIVAFTSVAPAPAGAAPRFDWVVTRYKAARNLHLDVKFYGYVRPKTDRAAVVGLASGISGPGARPSYWNWRYTAVYGGKGSVDAAGSAQGKGARRRVALPASLKLGRSAEVWVEGTIRLKAGQTYAFAVFAPGGVIDVGYSAPPSGVTAVKRTGTGATAIRVADLRHAGAGIEAGAVGAGALVHKKDVRTGLIGAVVATCDCVALWQGPGGRQGHWAAGDAFAAGPACWCSGVVGNGREDFAGPAGRWTWTWAGVTGVRQTGFMPLHGMSSPVIAAYAPVGDDWRYFTGKLPSLL